MGKVHIYHGDGKGKTTCAIGLCIRAAGFGKEVVFAQFLKAKPSSEIKILESIDNIKVMRALKCDKFTFQMSEQEKKEATKSHNEMLCEIIKEYEAKSILLVLDEIIGAVSLGFVSEELLCGFIKNNNNCEIVLTGRGPSEHLIELADYVSEIKKIKHPYDKGLAAREGIEF